MRKSVIFFAILLFVLFLAVVSERKDREEFTKDMVMSEETTAQNLEPDLDLELP
ncbi:MAG: hypothetical protein KJO94_02860 [Eudoraea sp.]|nr:hypothetical protein [Eudoraea sp.]MBT8322395.1 hypothetical protein [Eudoraea sp.]